MARAAKPQLESQKLLWRIQATSRDRDFHRKIRRAEGKKLGGASARGLVRRCAPNGAAASNQTF
jgi:hypothetical protein